ncbi:hypothetical protein E0Z10_g5426 [Xylaria hypoxylon]|uniref:Uncharacterized protein n=1 Tax=Xylaria hypoxylon TaxID=37992 RepID=A0A4Z0YXZ2_9PEZI|nr:hypothetical protein E0Z10_g5426 [Xylaria hypoxylon]
MPMLYCEGQRAFLRLREEIGKDMNDLSIFAWRTVECKKYHGVFERGPSEFRECGSIRSQGRAVPYLLGLNCQNDSKGTPISIWIHHHGGTVYSRSRAHEYGDVGIGDSRPLQKKNIYILKQLDALVSVRGFANRAGTRRDACFMYQFNGVAYFRREMRAAFSGEREFNIAGEYFIVAFGRYQDKE